MTNYENHTVLIVGVARSGVAAAKFLSQMGAYVILNDKKSHAELKDILVELRNENITYALGQDGEDFIEKVDLIVLSPGVPTDLPFIKRAKDIGKTVIGEFELASKFCRAPVAAITGTNGKTTTTTLVGEIFKAANRNPHVVGNIGIPFISTVSSIREKDVVVAEVSSFQLESIDSFHPYVSAILNFTPDHLNRHYTFENYIAAKANIFKNQHSEDYCILNYDDNECVKLAKEVNAKVVWFSRLNQLEEGVFVKNNKIFIKISDVEQEVCHINEIGIIGKHNLENALAATAIAFHMGVSVVTISNVLKDFRGVEHRIEFVDLINDVSYYNDSKGTNPDASIKAIEAMKSPTILIAGGMDKGSDFTEFIKSFGEKIKLLLVLGETADQIMNLATQQHFDKVLKVDTVEEAVQIAYRYAESGDAVLLSPACASWDMFESYEERGKVFKDAVKALRG